MSATTAAVRYSSQRRPTDEKARCETKANAPPDGRPKCASVDPTVEGRELLLCQTKHVEEAEVAGHPFHIHETHLEESQTLTGRRKSLCLVLHEGDKGERKVSAGEEVVGDGAH